MMMKWGDNKASSSHSSLITHIFPISWLSKFKQRKNSSEHSLVKTKKNGHLELPRLKEGRFYSGDDDSYWRLSFGDEEAAMMPTISQNSIWSDLEKDNEMGVPISYSRNLSFEDVKMDGREETRKKVSEMAGFSVENYALRRKNARDRAELKRARRKVAKDQKFRKLGPKHLEEKHAETEKVIFEVQPERMIHTAEDLCKSRASNSPKECRFSFPNSQLRTIEEDCTLRAVNLEEIYVPEEEEMSLKWKPLKNIKIAKMNSKDGQQRRSVYIKRESQRTRRKPTGRIKSYSPRTAAKIECKIKALEDMKKAKRMKKKRNETTPADITKKRAVRNTKKEKALGDTTAFDRYAVIKSSVNAEQDFRDSMIEMIIEKEIEKPEELEELLACYLTLNHDEFHDLIVKVFRQVWSELNELYLASKAQNNFYSDDY